MILLKELSNNRVNYPTVIVEIDADSVCDLHNILCKVAKDEHRFDELALELTNIYEMLHHGHLTDFGIYKNAKYFKSHDSFSNYGDEDDE